MLLGLAFLFAAILWALPLAGIPILLHLLFERKSPVIPFSTLRFIKAALQRTAARRKIQKWLLLACRMLLLALLIWAVSQPVKQLAWGFLSARPNTLAAIVVDLSPSMLLNQSETQLITKENEIIRSLLSGPLKDAQVALFLPGEIDDPQPRKASEILEQWTDFKVQSTQEPLVRAAERASEFLDRQQSGAKWLVVLSDLQKREFPLPIPPAKDARTILFDLHPDKFVSTGITHIRTIPTTPIAGLGVQAEIELFGQAGASAFVDLSLTKTDGTTLWTRANFPVNFQTTGLTKIRIPLDRSLGNEKYLILSAKLGRTDDLPWDDSLEHVLRLADKKTVAYIENPALPAANRLIRFCLNPFPDPSIPWALDVQSKWEGKPDALVLTLSDWPDIDQSKRILDYVKTGGTALLLTLPGLEETFASLPEDRREILRQLMPSSPAPDPNAPSGMFRAAALQPDDPLLEEIADPSARLDQLVIRRYMPFENSSDAAKSPLIGLTGETASKGGLFYRVTVGEGIAYWLTTLPDPLDVSPITHPLFPILLVKSCLGTLATTDASNIQAGQTATLPLSDSSNATELEITVPDGSKYRVGRNERNAFEYETQTPGIYEWRTVGDDKIVGLTRAGYRADESQLIYCKPQEALSSNGVVARSYEDLLTQAEKLDEPEPKWTLPIVIAMALLCLEALIAAWSTQRDVSISNL